MIYLAGPYNHVNPIVMEERFELLTRFAANLMKEGQVVYSPITHNHPIAIRYGLPRGWDYWEKFDTVFLRAATRMVVVTLDGWEDSQGVGAEILLATQLNLPITYVSMNY